VVEILFTSALIVVSVAIAGASGVIVHRLYKGQS